MLNVARRHAEAEGFGGRCTFLADYLSGAPMDAHDAATSLLVSHFLTETGARQSFFADIAARLKPGGAALQSGPMRLSGGPEETRAGWVSRFGRVFGVHGPSELEALIAAAGFTPPAPVFQAARMRGWTAARS